MFAFPLLFLKHNRLTYTEFDDVPSDFNASTEQDRPVPPRQNTDYFTTTIEDRKVNVERVPTGETHEVLHNCNSDHNGWERAPINEHGLTISHNHEAPSRNHFGLADGLPPLQELESRESTQSEKEKHEIEEREHKAQREYYNQYRNPIARWRAKYPQASAEFLATFVYLFLGLCVNLSVATSREATGSFETQAWG